jgi:hypothetical protein
MVVLPHETNEKDLRTSCDEVALVVFPSEEGCYCRSRQDKALKPSLSPQAYGVYRTSCFGEVPTRSLTARRVIGRNGTSQNAKLRGNESQGKPGL